MVIVIMISVLSQERTTEKIKPQKVTKTKNNEGEGEEDKKRSYFDMMLLTLQDTFSGSRTDSEIKDMFDEEVEKLKKNKVDVISEFLNSNVHSKMTDGETHRSYRSQADQSLVLIDAAIRLRIEESERINSGENEMKEMKETKSQPPPSK